MTITVQVVPIENPERDTNPEITVIVYRRRYRLQRRRAKKFLSHRFEIGRQ